MPRLILLAACCLVAAARTCDFRFTCEDSYSNANLSAYHITTRSLWSMNGVFTGCGAGTTMEAFIERSDASLAAELRRFVGPGGDGAAIVNGTNTTNALVIDCETPVHFQNLGSLLNKNATAFRLFVEAVTRRVRVTRSVFPRAKLALYGTPVWLGHSSTPMGGTNASLAGYLRAGELGLYDGIDFGMPCLYYAYTSESPHHAWQIHNYTTDVLTMASLLRNSTGHPLALAPVLWYYYRDKKTLMTPAVAREQVAQIEQFSQVASIFWWDPKHEPAVAEQWFHDVDVGNASGCFLF